MVPRVWLKYNEHCGNQNSYCVRTLSIGGVSSFATSGGDSASPTSGVALEPDCRTISVVIGRKMPGA